MIKELKYSLYRLRWKYPVLFRNKYPIHVDIEVTSACNAKCVFCPHSEEQQDFKKSFMKLDTFKKIIDQIEGKVPSIKLNLRGESTLHADFIEMLEYVKGKFIDIRLNTNLLFRNDYLLKAIIEVCTDITVSVNCYNYKSFCKAFGFKPVAYSKLKYDQFIRNINLLQENKIESVNKPLIKYSFVDDGSHKTDMKEFCNTLSKKDINIIYRKAERRNKQEIDTRSRKNCYMPERRLVIAYNGDVYPCCVMWHKPFIILGNIYHSTIEKIWNGKKIKELRTQLKNKNWVPFQKHDACLFCGSSESYIS